MQKFQRCRKNRAENKKIVVWTLWGFQLAFSGISAYDWWGVVTALCGNQWNRYVIQSIDATIQPQTLFFQFVQSVSVLDSRLDCFFHSTTTVAIFVILQDSFIANCNTICCARNCNIMTVFLLSLTCQKGYITDNHYWSTDLLPTDFTDYYNWLIDDHWVTILLLLLYESDKLEGT